MNRGTCNCPTLATRMNPCECYDDFCDVCGSESYLEQDEQELPEYRLICMDCFDRREQQAAENAAG